MKYLLDTDHISILQRRSGSEFAVLWARISRVPRADLGFSIVSFHEQVLGCHAYINRARKVDAVVRGYDMLARALRQFAAAPVVTFDAGASAVFDRLGPSPIACRYNGSANRLNRDFTRFGLTDSKRGGFCEGSWLDHRRLDVVTAWTDRAARAARPLEEEPGALPAPQRPKWARDFPAQSGFDPGLRFAPANRGLTPCRGSRSHRRETRAPGRRPGNRGDLEQDSHACPVSAALTTAAW